MQSSVSGPCHPHACLLSSAFHRHKAKSRGLQKAVNKAIAVHPNINKLLQPIVSPNANSPVLEASAMALFGALEWQSATVTCIVRVQPITEGDMRGSGQIYRCNSHKHAEGHSPYLQSQQQLQAQHPNHCHCLSLLRGHQSAHPILFPRRHLTVPPARTFSGSMQRVAAACPRWSPPRERLVIVVT